MVEVGEEVGTLSSEPTTGWVGVGVEGRESSSSEEESREANWLPGFAGRWHCSGPHVSQMMDFCMRSI